MTGYMAEIRKYVGHRTVIQCAASVICTDSSGRMLLGKRSDNRLWGYAGGALEIDERAEECAKRELFEEMGIAAESLEYFCVNSGPETHYVYPNGDEVSNFELVYLCRNWHGTPCPRDGEMEELRFFSPEEIDLSEISPPIRGVVAEYIARSRAEGRKQEAGDMFREVRKKKNEIGIEAARELLKNERRGVLAVNGDDGYPYAIPVNYLYSEEEGKIWMHGSRAGHKVDALKKCDKVCFTVYGNERLRDLPWAPCLQSTVVFGRCRLVPAGEESIRLLKRFAARYYPDAASVEEETAVSGAAAQMFEIDIEYMTGKQVQEK